MPPRNLDPVTGRPLSGFQALINQPRGPAANAVLASRADSKPSRDSVIQTTEELVSIANQMAKDKSAEWKCGPPGPMGWVVYLKTNPW
jgi:hypothetical protein